jgi:hypothetical protein
MAIVLITAAIAYASALFWFIRGVYLPRFYLSVPAAADPSGRYRLARAVRVILSFMHAIASFAVAAWLPLVVVITISQLNQPEWGLDVAVYSGFRVDLDQLPSVQANGLREAVISGKTMLDIDSSDQLAWFLFAATNFAAAIIVLYVLLQLRNIFVLLSQGDTFSPGNVSRLRRVGFTVIGAYVVAPLVQYFGWGAVVDGISFGTPGIELYRSFELSPAGIMIGLGVLVLAGVISEAAELREEQRLTV